jgi:pimeloyl-ACP methyl ester carboxylesterase
MQPRIVYLHGFASGPGSRKAQVLRRRARARLWEIEVPDLAGANFEHLTLSGKLETVGRIARSEAVSLIGSSLGGYLAALYAARHPEVARLVLMAPAFGFGRRFLDSIRQTPWSAGGGPAGSPSSTTPPGGRRAWDGS